MTDSGKHEWGSGEALQSGAAKGGEAAPVDVPWQDEDFARISRIDGKQSAKRRTRKAASQTGSTGAKPINAEPATADPLPASKIATPAEASGRPPNRTQNPHLADTQAGTPARQDRNPDRRLDQRPFPLPPEKERKESSPIPARLATASPRPASESFTGPRLDPPSLRPPQAPVTDIRDFHHHAWLPLVPAGFFLLAAVAVGAVLVFRTPADLPSKMPNLVSSTEPPTVRQPLDPAFADVAGPPRAAQPQPEHSVASLPSPAAASDKGENSIPPTAGTRPGNPEEETVKSPPPAEEESGTVEAKTGNREQQRAVSQPPPASGEAAPSAERSPAPRELASAEATLELPDTAMTTSLAGSKVVAEVQTRLSTLGYAPGPADGALREQTRDAIRAFQTDAGLSATGEIDSSLMTRLRRTDQVHWRFNG